MVDSRNITPEDYTDKDMQVVTQLAYIDFNSTMYGKTIGEIFNDSESYNEIYNQFMRKYKDDEGNWPEAGSYKESAMNAGIELLNSLKTDSIYSNWKIVDVRDRNSENGFYLCR